MNIFSFGRKSLNNKDNSSDPKPKSKLPPETIQIYSELSLKETLDEPIYVLISTNLSYSYLYLFHLNNNRSNLLQLNTEIYEQMLSIFYGILTNIQMKLFFDEKKIDMNNLCEQEKECFKIIDLIIVLSQTFSKNDKETQKKEFLLEKVQLHPIWKNIAVWKKVILFIFNETFEIQKQPLMKSKKDKRFKELMKEKEINVMKNVLITYKYHLNSFNVNFKFDEVLGEFISKYKLHDINEINF